MEWEGEAVFHRVQGYERGRAEEGKLQGENPHDMQDQAE